MLRQLDVILKERDTIRYAILRPHYSHNVEEQRKRAKVPLTFHTQNNTLHTQRNTPCAHTHAN